MALSKMIIYAYSDNTFSTQTGYPFTVYINPAEYSHKYEIRYNDVNAQGSSGNSPGFNRMGHETVSFRLYFDGTGVVASAPLKTVKEQIEKFRGVVFSYNGQIHSPNYLKLSWGTLLFKCRLVNLDIRYTLFQSDGTPLRAYAEVRFASYTAPAELAKRARRSSPDVSHVVSVKTGDTLPLMCYRIYGSSTPYLEVARINGLSAFRHLTPGTTLLFPPLKGGTS